MWTFLRSATTIYLIFISSRFMPRTSCLWRERRCVLFCLSGHVLCPIRHVLCFLLVSFCFPLRRCSHRRTNNAFVPKMMNGPFILMHISSLVPIRGPLACLFIGSTIHRCHSKKNRLEMHIFKLILGHLTPFQFL